MAGITKTLGGDRLGSGNKNKQNLHNYERSTHDLSESFKTSANIGLLYPCYTNVGLNGDTFELKIDAGCKTIPTRGPLFGEFKLQVDVFSIPIRLYQGILHNNPLNIGLKMAQVKLPQFRFAQLAKLDKTYEQYANENTFSPSCLEKYLGLSGIGINRTEDDGYYTRDLTAVWELAYYDIFKNYYANKQEENAYVIAQSVAGDEQNVNSISTLNRNRQEVETEESPTQPLSYLGLDLVESQVKYFKINGSGLNLNNIFLTWDDPNRFAMSYNLQEWKNKGYYVEILSGEEIIIDIEPMLNNTSTYSFTWDNSSYSEHLHLQSFPLENIDKMRYECLGMTTLGKTLLYGTNDVISHFDEFTKEAYYPYKAVMEMDSNRRSANTHPCVGLVTKTYQSDLFNNWVQTEWIDGDNGINAITSVMTTDGKFTIDALNLANKVYNMLNRIAISGGTYQDWQEAVYAEKAVRHAETPVYLGGMSSTIVFDTIVSTAATSEDALGSLAGKGRLSVKKGGKVIVKCTEPCILMAIMSITPYIDQTQGNAWYRTEINNVDDLHKPALDQIGFQDLLEEQMAWWSTSRGTVAGQEPENFKPAVGKVPAWINYMTAVDKAYGDFAQTEGKAFMVLGRNYSIDAEDGTIADATTYVDPEKFNYVFAYKELDSQNFWVQVYFDVKARRKMSAKQIPNL